MFKKLLLLPLVALCVTPAFADDKAPAKQSETAKAEDLWITDYAEAQKLARKTKKPIVMLFTGSDWCGWCIKLERQILSQKEFVAWAEKNAVLFKADFPKKTKPPQKIAQQNEKLSEMFGVHGFPTVFVTDANGKILGRTGYQDMSPAEYGKHLDEIIASKGRKKSSK